MNNRSQNKIFLKKGAKLADFLCIFGSNLKLMATSLGWWENSEIFLVIPEVYTQLWLTRHKDSQQFLFFRTP